MVSCRRGEIDTRNASQTRERERAGGRAEGAKKKIWRVGAAAESLNLRFRLKKNHWSGSEAGTPQAVQIGFLKK